MTGDARLVVTRDYGTQAVGGRALAKDASYSSFDGLLAPYRSRVGRGDRWFLYVNGVSQVGPSDPPQRPVARVWWDAHPGGPTPSAVVGSFPEPFLNGVGQGVRPTRVNCGTRVEVCERATAQLHGAGVVRTGLSAMDIAASHGVIRVVVAPWENLRRHADARPLEEGPDKSGVFARFVRQGAGFALEMLDERGEVANRLDSGAGLVAAIGGQEQDRDLRDDRDLPTWLVTGTDAAGVRAAVELLRAETLRTHFAVAVDSRDDRPLALPVAR